MKFELRAAFVQNSHQRMAGTTNAAFWVTADDGQEGWAYFTYEWDKRDVLAECLMAEPHIAAAVKEEIGEDSPMALSAFVIDETTGDLATLIEAQAKATSVSFEY